MPKQSTESLLRPIRADEVLPLECFMRASGLGRAALREARRSGLIVRRVHNRGFIIGSDWLDYLRTSSTSDSEASNT